MADDGHDDVVVHRGDADGHPDDRGGRPDPLEAGLRQTEAELEDLAKRLVPEPATPPEAPSPANPFDSDAAEGAAFVIIDLFRMGLEGLLTRPRAPRIP